MDCQYVEDSNYKSVNDWLLDIQHLIRMFQDKGLYISYWYKPYLQDSQNLEYIRVDSLRRDCRCNQVSKYMSLLDWVLYKLHLNRKEMDHMVLIQEAVKLKI